MSVNHYYIMVFVPGLVYVQLNVTKELKFVAVNLHSSANCKKIIGKKVDNNAIGRQIDGIATYLSFNIIPNLWYIGKPVLCYAVCSRPKPH